MLVCRHCTTSIQVSQRPQKWPFKLTPSCLVLNDCVSSISSHKQWEDRHWRRFVTARFFATLKTRILSRRYWRVWPNSYWISWVKTKDNCSQWPGVRTDICMQYTFPSNGDRQFSCASLKEDYQILYIIMWPHVPLHLQHNVYYYQISLGQKLCNVIRYWTSGVLQAKKFYLFIFYIFTYLWFR